MGTHLNCISKSLQLIQMGTHNICPYKVDKKNTGCNPKKMELLDCALVGVCVIITIFDLITALYTEVFQNYWENL